MGMLILQIVSCEQYSGWRNVRRPDEEAHEGNKEEARFRKGAAFLALLHVAETLAQLNAYYNDLQRREEVTDVFDAGCEPGVEVAALVHVVEEQTVERWNETNEGSD